MNQSPQKNWFDNASNLIIAVFVIGTIVVIPIVVGIARYLGWEIPMPF